MQKSDNTLSNWMDGIAYEIAFWNNVYRWPHTFKGMMNWSGFGAGIQLEKFDANSFLLASTGRKVLDVGCGMSYATGNHLIDGTINIPLDIHYIDPLAPYFNQILHRFHRNLPMIEFGMMEYLSAHYPNHDVDLVIIQNALDHSANPVKGIIEALETLRIGGVLYLNHHENEAELEQYKGFHQYNITQEEDNLIIWNKQEHRNVSNVIKEYADTQVYRHDNGHVIAVIHKTDNVPAQLLRDKDDKRILSQMLLTNNMKHRNISSTLAYRLNYWKYNTIQFFVQALPWSTKMKLKKLIGQA